MSTPKIRFKGFSDDWEYRKVTELGEIYIGLVTTMTSHYTDSGSLLIRNSDIKDGYFEFGNNPIYLDEEFSEQNASRKHQIGDVITVHTGDIGTSAVISEKEAGSIGFATIVTRPYKSKIKSDYLCTYLNTDTHKRFAMNISTGDGRNNYNLRDYYECIVPVPDIDEQTKISEYIKRVNSLINLHQRKCDELQKVKKYMLQKMFPKKGEKVPEIRFAGFTGDWEQRKLGEITGKTYGGGTPKTDIDEYWNGDIPWIQSSNLTENKLFDVDIQKHVTAKGLQKSATQLVPANSIAVVSHVGVGKLVFMPFQYTTSQDFISLAEIRTEPKFTCYAIYKRLQKDLHIVQGSAIKGITKEDLLNKEIAVPSYEEQEAIGRHFSNLDNLITLHQRKCDTLKEIKKYMLQNMFPKK